MLPGATSIPESFILTAPEILRSLPIFTACEQPYSFSNFGRRLKELQKEHLDEFKCAIKLVKDNLVGENRQTFEEDKYGKETFELMKIIESY